MFGLIMAATAKAIAVLQYAPSNVVVRWVRRREHLKWGIPVSLACLAIYLPVLYWAGETMRHDPNVLVGLAFFVALLSVGKFLALGPVSLVLLVIARIREAVALRRR